MEICRAQRANVSLIRPCVYDVSDVARERKDNVSFHYITSTTIITESEAKTMTDFDRFQPPGPRDELVIWAYCAWCGEPIYVGDRVTAYADGDKTHREHEQEYVTVALGIFRGTAA